MESNRFMNIHIKFLFEKKNILVYLHGDKIDALFTKATVPLHNDLARCVLCSLRKFLCKPPHLVSLCLRHLSIREQRSQEITGILSRVVHVECFLIP